VLRICFLGRKLFLQFQPKWGRIFILWGDFQNLEGISNLKKNPVSCTHSVKTKFKGWILGLGCSQASSQLNKLHLYRIIHLYIYLGIYRAFTKYYFKREITVVTVGGRRPTNLHSSIAINFRNGEELLKLQISIYLYKILRPHPNHLHCNGKPMMLINCGDAGEIFSNDFKFLSTKYCCWYKIDLFSIINENYTFSSEFVKLLYFNNTVNVSLACRCFVLDFLFC